MGSEHGGDPDSYLAALDLVRRLNLASRLIWPKYTDAGLVYKNRHGRYSFAVPLFGQFILRQVGGA